jgi:hypothetical protein
MNKPGGPMNERLGRTKQQAIRPTRAPVGAESLLSLSRPGREPVKQVVSRSTDQIIVGDGPSIVAGRYRLLAVVGAGGMGRVWRAHDDLLDREVAVKEIAVTTRTSQDQTVREARAAARLDHPHVVRIYDVVQEVARSWIVMEFVDGRSLQELVRQDGPLNHREAARIGLAVLDALRTAHAADVLHCDVKPQNVLVTAEGRVVLTDFGLATTLAERRTETGDLLGSPHYVAPERLHDPVSRAESDLWSLGATLYAAVEGRPPFARPTAAESLAALAAGEPHEPRHPGPLHPVIADLLVPDPDERMTLDELNAALRAVTTRAIGVSRVPRQRKAPPAPPPEPRRRWRAAALAGVAVAVFGGSAVAYATTRADRPASAPAPTTVSAAPADSPSPCGTSPAEAASTSDKTATAVAPDGWIWHDDRNGFRIAVPAGWLRAASGATVCFRDPYGGREFAVDTAAPLTQRPLEHWQAAEKAGTVPGYQKVSMGVLLLKRGGADWEYSWQPATGPRLHTRQVLLATSATRAYLMQWTTRDQDWSLDVPIGQQFVATVS